MIHYIVETLIDAKFINSNIQKQVVFATHRD